MISVTGIVHIAHNENPGIWYDLISTKAVIALPFDSHDAVMVRMNKGIELANAVITLLQMRYQAK